MMPGPIGIRSHQLHTWESEGEVDGASAGCRHSFDPESTNRGLVTLSQSRFVSFLFFWSGNVRQKLGFLHPNASLSAGHPCGYREDSSFWQRVASSRLLKGLPWPGAT